MNNKKKGIIITLFSLFMIFTSLVLFVIGVNSNTLINNTLKYIFLGILILSFLMLLLGIRNLFKYKRRRGFKKSKVTIFAILISIYMIGCSGFLYILYGPQHGFRDWLITTAMGTMNHQYLCKWFYSDAKIYAILGENYVDDGGRETDASLIDHEESTTYANEYEREVLERDKDAVYKVIRFKINGCDAYLGVVYDASLISVGYTKWFGTNIHSGQYVYDMAKEQGSVLTINGGGFEDIGSNGKGADPIGITISKGKILTDSGLAGGGVIGFNKDNVLVLRKNTNAKKLIEEGIRDAVTMGPFLIVNGKPSFIKGNGGWGYAARTAIGQRKDGIVLFLVVDSNEFRTNGASMKDLTDIMMNYGAINAANLDGGTSSAMVVEGKMINDPIDSLLRHRTRGIPTVFNVIPKKDTEE